MCKFAFTADERGKRRRQIVRERHERSQRREGALETFHVDLMNIFGTFEIFERVCTEIGEMRTARQLVANELCRHAGEQDLSAVTGCEQSRNAIDGRSEIVAVALVRRPGVNGNPHAHATDIREIRLRKRFLNGDGGAHRIVSAFEGDAECITYRFEDEAVTALDFTAYDRIVPPKCFPHRKRISFPPRRASLDIGEHKSNRTSRGGMRGASRPRVRGTFHPPVFVSGEPTPRVGLGYGSTRPFASIHVRIRLGENRRKIGGR